jgi:uncharacterized repeat protein (TIGR01451 family)
VSLYIYDGTSVEFSDSASIAPDAACPDLTITKTADATSVDAGSPIGFTITLHNAGPGESTGTTLTDPLPSGPGISWSIANASGPATCSITGSVGSQSLGCGSFSLASGASETVRVTSTTTAASCAAYKNTASYASGNSLPVSGSAQASELVKCLPNLTITKTADATSVNAGSPIGFTITLHNAGTGLAVVPILTDPLPSGPGIHWSIATTGTSGPMSCSITWVASHQILTCGSLVLAASASETVHVVSATTAASCAIYNNTASYASGNDGIGSAKASETVNCPNLTITKTSDASSVDAGSPIGFTITLSNAGPGASTGTSLTDPLPSGSGVSWSIASQSGPASCSITGVVGTQSLNCVGSESSTFVLAAGASETVHVVSDTIAASCAAYDNTSSYSSGNSVPGSGSASASETVNCPDLTITKTADATSVDAGSPIGFTITLSNKGMGASTGTRVTDSLPGGPSGSGVSWSIASQSGPASCSITGTVGTQSLNCVGSESSTFVLAAGASETVHVVSDTTVASCATYDNTARFTSENGGSGSSAQASETASCPTPTGSVSAITSSATPTGGVLATSTPTTGAGPSPLSAFVWTLGTILLLLGGGFLLGRRRISPDNIEDI